MFSRAAIRIGTGCSIGALFVTTAYAAENKKLVKVSELPIYGEPHPPQLVYVDEEISAFRKHISVARQTVWDYSDSVKDTTNTVVSTWNKFYATSMDLLQFLREDSATVPRIIFISISGFGGIIAGYRGGAFRKLVYASLGMGASASICYPQQASQLTQEGWTRVRAEATRLWSDELGVNDNGATDKAGSQDSTVSEQSIGQTESPVKEEPEPPRSPGDQSKKADRELLTTRSSV